MRQPDEDETDGSDQPAGDRISDEVDDALDEIDAVLEENAEPFVRSFVTRGGQGWSTFLDPSFYVGAAAAAMIGGATWDGFKNVLGKVRLSLAQVPGGQLSENTRQGLDPVDQEVEATLEIAWNTARGLIEGREPQHTIDEAAALHWVLFSIELLHELNTVRLDPDQYDEITRIAAVSPGSPTPAALVKHIIGDWLHSRQQG